MDQSEMEAKVLAMLRRFASLDYQTVLKLTLLQHGLFCYANEQVLREALASLRSQGAIQGAVWGPFRLSTPAPQAKRRRHAR